MSTFPKTRIRIAADLFSYTAFGDVLRAAEDDYRPKFRAGDDIQFEVGLFNNGELLDLSGIAAVTLEIKPLDAELTERFDDDDDADNYDLRGPDLSLTPIRSKTLPASDLNAALTKSAWDSNAAEQCHALITLSSAESNIAAGDRWLTVGIVTDDSPGRIRTICAGPIRVLGGGLSQAASPEGNSPETFYNTVEADARFLKLANNLSDLADVSAARGHLGLGETDSPTFAGLTVEGDGVVDFNDNRLGNVGNPATDSDALNRQSADARYLRQTENGADITDISAFRDNLSVYSRPETDALAAKTFSPSLYLNGLGGYVATPSALRNVFTASNTVAVRVRLTGDLPNKDGVLFGTTRTSGTHQYMLKVYTNGLGRLFWGDSTTGNQVDLPGFATGWGRHSIWVVAVHDTTADTVTLYLDGIAFGASIPISNLSGNDLLPMFIGAVNSNGTPADFSELYLEEVVVFNRTLNAEEVATLYAPQPKAAAPVLGYGRTDNLMASVGNWTAVSTWGSFVPDGSDGFVGTADSFDTARLNTGLAVARGYRVSFSFTANVTSGTVDFTILGAASTSSPATLRDLVVSGGTPLTVGVRLTAGFSGAVTITGVLTTDAGNLGVGVFASSGATVSVAGLDIASHGLVASHVTAQDARVGFQFLDVSPNALHGLLSPTGCTWLEAGERGRFTLGGFTADAWLGGSERAIIPAGYRISTIIATETAGMAASNLALGTTANGIDLVSSFSLLANETKLLSVAAPFSAKSAAKPVHINDAPGGPWGGANISLSFILEKF